LGVLWCCESYAVHVGEVKGSVGFEQSWV
jgi:hypothetical protein